MVQRPLTITILYMIIQITWWPDTDIYRQVSSSSSTLNTHIPLYLLFIHSKYFLTQAEFLWSLWVHFTSFISHLDDTNTTYNEELFFISWQTNWIAGIFLQIWNKKDKRILWKIALSIYATLQLRELYFLYKIFFSLPFFIVWRFFQKPQGDD